MKVKMLTLMAGPEGTCYPGDSIEVTSGEAAELISGGVAVSVSVKEESTDDAVGNNGNDGSSGAKNSRKRTSKKSAG